MDDIKVEKEIENEHKMQNKKIVLPTFTQVTLKNSGTKLKLYHQMKNIVNKIFKYKK